MGYFSNKTYKQRLVDIINKPETLEQRIDACKKLIVSDSNTLACKEMHKQYALDTVKWQEDARESGELPW